MSSYAPPLDRLLDREIAGFGSDWPNYVEEYGLTAEHVSELIRMASDAKLYESVETDSWATVHARRAVGQLRAVEAAGPLLAAMDAFDKYDEFFLIDHPKIFGMIGSGAIPALASRFEEKRPSRSTRFACAESLEEIAKAHPEAREECIAVLTKHLAKKEDEDDDDWALNGFVLASLLELKAVESAGVIEEAFAADVIDESIAGGWTTARHELGLGPAPVGNDIAEQWRMMRMDPLPQLRMAPRRPDLKKLKMKQNAAKKARKRNRKR